MSTPRISITKIDYLFFSVDKVKWTKATEITVITDRLLEECALKTYCYTDEAKKIAIQEDLDFSKIKILNLEFKNILKICNLWQFKNLKKLNLSNNVIECIEGLEELTNLTCLDLSFNQIVAINGLENLENLTDLSLSNNKIKIVENLDCLKKLDILSLNDNLIEDYNNVKYFFPLRSLRSVSFLGNPIQRDKDYESKVIAFIPSLLYLDFKLITDEMKEKALRVCGKEFKKLTNADQNFKEKESIRIDEEQKRVYYKAASLENIGDNQYFKQLLHSHKRGHLLFTCPALEDDYEEFSAMFEKVCIDWCQQGVKHYEQRVQEVDDFESCTKRLLDEELLKARKNVHDFHELKQNVLLNMGLLNQEDDEDQESEIKIKNHASYLYLETEKYWKNLMTLEMDVAGHINIIEDVFQLTLTEVTENFLPKIADFHARLQSAYDLFMENIKTFFTEWCQKSIDEKQQAIRTMEVAHGEIASETLELLNFDQAKIDGILYECHTLHTSKLTEKCESLQKHLMTWLATTLSQHHEDELERHRQRIIEIMLSCRSAEQELIDMCKYCDIPYCEGSQLYLPSSM